MKLVRNGKISFLQPGNLSSNVVAGFSTRNGGVSRQPYNSLNLGPNSGDVLANVEGNRSTFARSFDLVPHQLLTVKQVHGKDILLIDEENPDLSHFLNLEVDAIVTNQPNIIIGVLTADCYPVLLWHPTLNVIAAVHVGWRGAANGIIEKTVKTICNNFSCQAEELFAAIGPGIAAHKFEVRPTGSRRFPQRHRLLEPDRRRGQPWSLEARSETELPVAVGTARPAGQPD